MVHYGLVVSCGSCDWPVVGPLIQYLVISRPALKRGGGQVRSDNVWSKVTHLTFESHWFCTNHAKDPVLSISIVTKLMPLLLVPLKSL